MIEKLTHKVLLDQLRSTSRELFIVAYERKLGDKPHAAFIGKPLGVIALKSVCHDSLLKVSPASQGSLDSLSDYNNLHVNEGLDLRAIMPEQGVEVFYQPELSDASGGFDFHIEKQARSTIAAAQMLSHETLAAMATTTEKYPFIKDWTDNEYRILESLFNEPTSGFTFEYDTDLPLNGHEPEIFLSGYKDFMEKKSVAIRDNLEQHIQQGSSGMTIELGKKDLAAIQAAIARVDAILDR